MLIVTDGFVCKGTYKGKNYENGRLVVAEFENEKSEFPMFIKVEKCTAELARELKKKCPCTPVFYYDRYGKILGMK